MRSAGLPRLVGLFVFALTLWLIAGCGGSQQEGDGQQQQEPVVGEFAGEVSDANAFVALVAGESQDGEEAREVRAYLCDGREINEWFRGTAEGNKLDLTSEGGAHLEGNLASEASTGTITLDDSESFIFTADPATGVAGLYEVVLSDNGQLLGTSQRGALLEGRVADVLEEDGSYPVSGTITPPEGEPRSLEAVSNTTEPGELRFIVLADGRVKGSNRGGGFSKSFLPSNF